MRGRDQTLKYIHRNLLHSVGPIAGFLSKLIESEAVEPDKVMEYTSATLVLMESCAAKILVARRENAIREFNTALLNDVGPLPDDNATDLIFGSSSLKSLTDLQRDRAQMNKLVDHAAKKQN